MRLLALTAVLMANGLHTLALALLNGIHLLALVLACAILAGQELRAARRSAAKVRTFRV
ncbi:MULTISPECIES: hypothetical protein [unclassified Crossiella]|uniref:hypothetical protein n=1 Tax=unclassified Crossiella TaxID=2620835 RepID=UPI001FFF7297|nr:MULTISPECIES: hypothetical protein [unclassified Crossiella]MCK2240925.1 hypothetical protein [Crossiella sp. S99.2]MCK2253931.1 hypothetical protein [Crossiella sp. S99.1]